MASVKLMTTSDGKRFYKISVSRGYGKSPYTKRWYVPDGLAERTIKRELSKATAEFELQCSQGEIKTRKELKAEEQQRRREARKILTFQQFCEECFLPRQKLNTVTTTYEQTERDIKAHFYDYFGDMLIADITTADVDRFISKLRTTPSKRTKRVLAFETVNTICHTLHHIFEYAVECKLIDDNPLTKGITPKRNKNESPQQLTTYTVEDIQRIKEAVDNEPLKWRVMLYVLIESGIRRGEVAGLQWDSINYSENKITICKNRVNTKAGTIDTRTKGGRDRYVFISDTTISLLKELRKEQVSCGIFSDYVFTKRNSAKGMNPQTIDYYTKHFGEKFGIEDFHPHALRHSFVSLSLINGGDIKSVSELAGHSNPSITLRVYSHTTDEAKKKASQTFIEAITKEA